MENEIRTVYEAARVRYRRLGVDTEAALEALAKIPLSLHCWQGDDVRGFETPEAALSGGGIQVTGNYPGRARSIAELQADLEKAYNLIPGSHRLNLHAIYGDFNGERIDRDEIGPGQFSGWMEWSREKGIPLDFNGTFFSHPRAASGFTLSSKDDSVRSFWIRHARRCRQIAAAFGENQGSPCFHNVWIPDGHKDIPADRMGHRRLLRESLDAVFSDDLSSSLVKDAVETKLFGIGSEAFVVGSHEFYLGYAKERGKMPCLDLGHFHPTELIADKISAILLFFPELLLHVSRPMRWDSDHVVILNDDIRFLMQEIVRSGRIGDVHIGLDFFDATLNRIGAWTLGARSALKGLLLALLEPAEELLRREEAGDYYGRLALLELAHTLPFGAVWDYYCLIRGVPGEEGVMAEVEAYQREVLSCRRGSCLT